MNNKLLINDNQSKTEVVKKERPKLWVRIVVFLAVLLTAWHILASFLWIAPFSENARSIVPGGQKTLSSYMLPFFGQSWSVFAPEPINGDYHFNVRAKLGDGTETGWVSATDVELSMLRYNLFPPRAGIQSSEVAAKYKNAYDDLTEQQRAIITSDFSIQEWEIGLKAALEGQEDSDTNLVAKIMSEERRSAAYATQVAYAVWGEDVEEVQFRVSRQNIIPFAERHNPNAKRPDPQIVLPGWRNPLIEEGQNSKNFEKVFLKQYERNLR